MKRILFFLIPLSFQISADQAALSSQFLKLLAPPETPVVADEPAKSKPQTQKPTNESKKKHDPFLQILTGQEFSRVKLYKENLEDFAFEYSNHLEYAEGCKGFPAFDEKKLTKTEKELAKKYGKLIAKGYEAPWYLQYINEQIGHGAFAAEDIKEGQMIGEYTGIIVEVCRNTTIELSYGWTIHPPENYLKTQESFFVDARKLGNFTRFINHSFYPNVKAVTVYSDGQWHMVYIAARSIKKDEQLLVNYGHGYWFQKSYKPIEMGL